MIAFSAEDGTQVSPHFDTKTRLLARHGALAAHADETVVFYFPEERVLFQGDVFSQLESGGMPPAVIEVNHEPVCKVEALGLRVGTLIGVQAGALPWQTLRDAVARQSR